MCIWTSGSPRQWHLESGWTDTGPWKGPTRRPGHSGERPGAGWDRPGQQSPRPRATEQVWQALPTAPPVLLSQLSSEAPSSRKPSQTTSPRLLSSQPHCHILANVGVRVGVPTPPISHCPQWPVSRGDTGTGSSCRPERPGAAHSTPRPTRPGETRAPAAGTAPRTATYHPEEGPCGQGDVLLDGGQHAEDEADQDDEEAAGQEDTVVSSGNAGPGPAARGAPRHPPPPRRWTRPLPSPSLRTRSATRAQNPRRRCTEWGAASLPWRPSSDPP